jgi:hypothetical protein
MSSLSLKQAGASRRESILLLALNSPGWEFQILFGRWRRLYRPNETIPALGNRLDISRGSGRVEECRPQALNDRVEPLFKFNVGAIGPETTR